MKLPEPSATAKLPDLPDLPDDKDLRRLIHFSSQDGRIWLSDQRMLLMHATALAELRSELIYAVGTEHTRRAFMRAGFASGTRDATLARQVRPNTSLFEAFAVGPQLHMLEGAVRVTPKIFELDPERDHYLGIYRWDHSWEVDVHVRQFGPQHDPACWMLLGYASGYTSAFFERPVFYKETQCTACGHSHCMIEGRFLHEWEDGEALAKDYDAKTMFETLAQQPSDQAPASATEQANPATEPLIGQSDAFLSAIELAKKAAPTRVTVLLTGETGVGKERFARLIHQLSGRRDGPFVAVNCAAIPADLIESELFGAVKGAYTGSVGARSGRFERAHGGTLLLDEIGELPLELQAKLLRVLQTGEIDRLGDSKTTAVDVRVLAATHVDLETAVAQGQFRRDLYYRLSVFPIHLPALRERPGDIEALSQHLLQRFARLHGKRVLGLTDRAVDALRNYPWPGNVRELENLLERGVILAENGQMIDARVLFPSLPEPSSLTIDSRGDLLDPTTATAHAVLDAFVAQNLHLPDLECALIEQAVARARGNLSAAARLLGLTRPQLAYRLQRVQTEGSEPSSSTPSSKPLSGAHRG